MKRAKYIIILLTLFFGFPWNASGGAEPTVSKADINEDVHFILYTRNNGPEGEEILFTEESIKNNDFDPMRNDTVFLVHGFGGSGDGERWPQATKNAFVNHHDHNIIVVDWAKLTIMPFYEISIANAKLVAQHTSEFIHLLMLYQGLDLADVTLIGHSLGGQLVGQIGYRYHNEYGKTLGKIIGLDAAGPEFHDVPLEDRLDESDAATVIGIHTNGGTIPEGCIGYYDQVGHMDIYSNGGRHQPGCTDAGNFLDLIIGSCSHMKPKDYMVESIINPEAFVSTKCGSWEEYKEGLCEGNEQINMGYHTPTQSRGKFYLDVNEESPYSVN